MHTAKTRFTVGCAFVALLCLAGCGNRDAEWTEQVEIEPGSTVLVHQAVETDVRTPIGDAPQSFTLGVRLKILGQNPDAPEWIDARDPILLMRDPITREFVLVATTGDSRVWDKHNRPMNPYWMFRLRDGAWNEESMADFVFDRESNLVLSIGKEFKNGGYITLDDKDAWNRKLNVTRSYRRIKNEYQFGRD